MPSDFWLLNSSVKLYARPRECSSAVKTVGGGLILLALRLTVGKEHHEFHAQGQTDYKLILLVGLDNQLLHAFIGYESTHGER
ncbi:hypothetical protein MD484_g1712, partial [Candolleomyces efflorescens]